MSENRRSINLWNSTEETSGRDFDLTIKAMEDQLRLQGEIASVERERQVALEKTREQQELFNNEAEKGLQSLQSEAADSGYSAAIERGTGQMVEAEKAFTEMKSSSEKFTSSTGSGLKSLFRTLLKGELSSATDLWGAFCGFLINSWSSAMSKMASRGIENLVGSLFNWSAGAGRDSASSSWTEMSVGSYEYHSGGVVGQDAAHRMVSPLVFAGAARLHSGLAPDEFPAILQRGEVVIPKGKWSYADAQAGGSSQSQSMRVEVKIDNQSTTPLKLEQGSISQEFNKIVVGIVAKNINENGVLRQMLKTGK